MPTILYSHPADVLDANEVDPETGERGRWVDEPEVLSSLDGLQYDEEAFSDYIADGGFESIANIGITGGTLRFVYDEASRRLLGTTEYSSARKLTKDEAALLLDYTVGQWSDGVGSNFYQDRLSQGLAPQMLVMDITRVHFVQS